MASAGLLPNEPVPILSQDLDVGFDGTFRNNYETGNGIRSQEQGHYQPGPVAGEGENFVQGQAQWTAPDGTPVSISWTADGNGAHFEGSHLPVSPPIPEAIQRSLEYNAAHPEQDEVQTGQVRQVGQAGRRF